MENCRQSVLSSADATGSQFLLKFCIPISESQACRMMPGTAGSEQCSEVQETQVSLPKGDMLAASPTFQVLSLYIAEKISH